MGLLSLGTPLEWEKIVPHCDTVRKNGIRQFLSTFEQVKGRRKDYLLWGDEVRIPPSAAY
jgi:hypothetical protein